MGRSHCKPNTRRRKSAVAVSLGAASAGLMIAAVSQIADPPCARADDPISVIVESIQVSFDQGAVDFGRGAADFASGAVPAGLAWDITGANDYLFAPAIDVVTNAVYISAGNPDGLVFAFPDLPAPTDLASTATDVQSYLDSSQTYFADAAADFSADQLVAGLNAAVLGSEDLIGAPEIGLLGLTDTLLGL